MGGSGAWRPAHPTEDGPAGCEAVTGLDSRIGNSLTHDVVC